MRVIQVVNVRWYNATAWYGVNLAHMLKKAGHEVLVVGLPGTTPLLVAGNLGLPVRALSLNSSHPLVLAGLSRQADRLLREFQPDIVNCHRGEAFFIWALLKKRHGFALVRTRGDQRLPKNSRINRFLHGRAADAVIATNSAMGEYFRQVLGVPPQKLRVILGGVDTERFFPDPDSRLRTRAELGFAADDFVLGLVGRLDQVKGARETIMAAGLAASASCLNLRLLLVGFESQHTRADLEIWAREAGLGRLGERIFLTDRVDKPEDFINAMDLGILSSLGSEAIARAALEIMACGVPLVGSRVGVMPDLLPAACLFEPGDIEAMAGFILRASDKNWLRRAGRTSLAKIHGQPGLTMGDFLAQSLRVYQEALSNAK